MEIEAKFKVANPGTFWRLQIIDQLAGFSLLTCHAENVRDTYLDTRGRRLLKAGYSLCKRDQDDGIWMTLKTVGKASGAIHRREMWELALSADRPPAKWPDGSLRQQVLAIIGKARLQPLLDLRQQRVVRCLNAGDQAVAEFSLDSVSIMIGSLQKVYRELEVALIPPASEQELVKLVACLQDEWKLEPELLSKLERGLGFVSEERIKTGQAAFS